jgi:hypothetical protein
MLKSKGQEHLIATLKAFLIKCKDENDPKTLLDSFKGILKSEHPSLALNEEQKKELSKWVVDYLSVKVL